MEANLEGVLGDGAEHDALLNSAFLHGTSIKTNKENAFGNIGACNDSGQETDNSAFIRAEYAEEVWCVEYAVGGGTGKMVAFTRETKDGKYHCGITYKPLSATANVENKLPREWINERGNYVTQDFIDYALPLIQGENTRKIENGLPRFCKLKKKKAK